MAEPGRQEDSFDADALFLTARELIAGHDYQSAIELLEEIPAEARRPPMVALLSEARGLQEEVDMLLAIIQQAESRRDFTGLESTLKKLLKLKPGHERARELLRVVQKGIGDGLDPLAERRLLSQHDGWGWPAVAACVLVALVAFGGITLVVRSYLADDDGTRPLVAAPEQPAGGVAAPERPVVAPDKKVAGGDPPVVAETPSTADPAPEETVHTLGISSDTENDDSPWISSDGLRLYWSRSPAPGEILFAERAAADKPFGKVKKLFAGDGLTLTEDEREMIFTRKGAAGKQEAILYSATRPSRGAPFTEPKSLFAVDQTSSGNVQPCLSPDGLTLVYRVVDSSKPKFYRGRLVYRTRRNREGEWGPAFALPLVLPPEIGPDLMSPSFTPDGLTLYASQRNHERPNLLEVVRSTRHSFEDPFADFSVVSVDGEALIGLSPRFVPGTDELFYRRFRVNKDMKPDWDLDVVERFQAHHTLSPPAREESDPLAAVRWGSGSMANETQFRHPDWLYLHPPSQGKAQAKFFLAGQYSVFVAAARVGGPQATLDSSSPLTFAVYGDGDLLWESKPIRRSGETAVCRTGVLGVENLELVVRCPGSNMGAEAFWYQPHLLWAVNREAGKRVSPVPLSALETLAVHPGPWPVGFWGPQWLSMHPPRRGQASARFRLGRRHERFYSEVRLGRPGEKPEPRSSTTFAAYGDGKLLWKSEPLRIGGKTDKCSVSVKGVDVLELRTTCSGDEYGAHACWQWPLLFQAPAEAIDFDFTTDNAGWVADRGLSHLWVRDGLLCGEMVNIDPNLIREFLNVPPDRYTKVVVRMKLNKGDRAELFWTTEAEPQGSKSKSLSVKTINDGAFHDYTFDVGGHPLWKGQTIRKLRLDPMVTSDLGQIVEIDSIRGE